jgi:hypothetical protein
VSVGGSRTGAVSTAVDSDMALSVRAKSGYLTLVPGIDAEYVISRRVTSLRGAFQKLATSGTVRVTFEPRLVVDQRSPHIIIPNWQSTSDHMSNILQKESLTGKQV